MNFKITTAEIGQRLDKWLAKKNTGFSRSAIKKYIISGQILVNQKKVKASYQLNHQDQISIAELPAEKIFEPTAEKIKLDLVYEDCDLVIINKPAGLVVHPDYIHHRHTLVNALLNYWPSIKNVGDPERPGIVHRLDQDTSGLIICAKKQLAYQYLVEQFKKRALIKKYYALVYGRIKEQTGIIAYSLGKSCGKKLKMTTTVDKEALTRYCVKKYYRKKQQDYTLLEVTPKTGRTHQIRVHLARIGHPIVGDATYSFKRHKRTMALSRQFLHAYYLQFTLPNGLIKEFKIGLPSDLKIFLESIKS